MPYSIIVKTLINDPNVRKLLWFPRSGIKSINLRILGAPKLALARIGVGAPKLALAKYPSRLRLDVKASFDAPATGPCVTSVNLMALTLRRGNPYWPLLRPCGAGAPPDAFPRGSVGTRAKTPSFRHGCRNPVPWTVTCRLHKCLIQVSCQPLGSHPCDWIPAVHAGMTGLLHLCITASAPA